MKRRARIKETNQQFRSYTSVRREQPCLRRIGEAARLFGAEVVEVLTRRLDLAVHAGGAAAASAPGPAIRTAASISGRRRCHPVARALRNQRWNVPCGFSGTRTGTTTGDQAARRSRTQASEGVEGTGVRPVHAVSSRRTALRKLPQAIARVGRVQGFARTPWMRLVMTLSPGSGESPRSTRGCVAAAVAFRPGLSRSGRRVLRFTAGDGPVDSDYHVSTVDS
jgi:hypothetical protein